MFIFLRLLLAHFIGDFPLQFNKIYALKLKRRGARGTLPHAIIVGACLIVFAWPYLDLPDLWILVLFITATHLFQDSFKVKLKKKKYSLWLYLLDQLFHIATISTLFLTCLRYLAPPPSSGNIFVSLYTNDTVIVYLIALILATYNGHYLIRNIKSTFYGSAGTCTSVEKWIGIGERALIVTFAFLGGFYLFLLLPLALLRPLISLLGRNRLSICEHFLAPSEIILSWSIALVTGLALSILIL